MNGFANGYELPAAGVYEVVIRFGPQDAFVRGAAISLTSLGIIFVVAVALVVWFRVRPHSSPTF